MKTDPVDLQTLNGKLWLTPAEAVALGYFASEAAAANRRWRFLAPPWHQETSGGRILYSRAELDAWMDDAKWDPEEAQRALAEEERTAERPVRSLALPPEIGKRR